MKSKWRIIFSFIILLSINIEKPVLCLNYGLSDKHGNNLKLLQDSLRWIRSPITSTRFRPWGGKRSASTEYSFINIPYYQTICQKPIYSLDLSLHFICQKYSRGTDDMKNTAFNEDNNLITYNKGISTENDMQSEVEKGMPENVNDGFASLVQKPIKNIEFLRENGINLAEKRAHTFYPWVMKSGQTFFSWEGRRRNAFYPWAAKRDHTFYPWAGKRVHTFFPWAGKRNEDYVDFYNQELNKTNCEGFNQTHSGRRKRDTTMKNTDDSNLMSKRIYVQYWRENTKRIGVLNDLLKKFETIKEEPNSRSFHPWAGRKRTENNNIDTTNSDSSFKNLIMHFNLNQAREKEKPKAVKRSSFYPWAGMWGLLN